MAVTGRGSRHYLGLRGKLILAVLVAGTIPIVVGLWVAYDKGNTELQEVIGDGFKALAKDSAFSIDRDIQRAVAADTELAQLAGDDSGVRDFLIQQASGRDAGRPAARFDWPKPFSSDGAQKLVIASWVTGPDTVAARGGVLAGLRLDRDSNRYAFEILTPIQQRQTGGRIGWLHRLYDVKRFLDPLIYPIRFGDTGHVMVIDDQGAIVSCPLLPTGSRIDDLRLVSRVATDRAGWIKAEADGHGARQFSLIGHAPLPAVTSLLSGGGWYTFVWQDSREIFAPARSLMNGVTLAGVLAVGLLGVLGYYASRHIVQPIQKLRTGAIQVAGGDLDQKLEVRTGDEIEELAEQFDEMRLQLRKLIGGLEEKVEERTRELRATQAEKDQVVEQLIQAEKVAAIGTMASGIGHEINNPLYAILGMAEAIRDATDVARCREHAQDIIKYSTHISDIVKDLSGYIRPAARQDLEAVDINRELAEAIAMARHALLSDHVSFQQDLGSVSAVQAKPEELRQAFFNIIRNGIQAMKGNGTLAIHSGQKDGWVEVQIRDSGPGIAKEHQGKIFDPFFTTKGPDEGEGLGLYIVQQIVKKYQGSISLDSRPGQGASFLFQFPPSGEHR